MLTATTQVLAWTRDLFHRLVGRERRLSDRFSEIFPLEIRGLAIAIFYAAGHAGRWRGGAIPVRGAGRDGVANGPLFWGYVGGGALMLVAAAVEWAIGVKAEGQSLEAITKPLSAR